MPSIVADAFVFPVLCLGLGAPAMALAFLGLERYGGARYARFAAGVAALALSAVALVLWATNAPLAVVGATSLLAAACVAARATYSPAVRAWARRLFAPKGVWAVVLVGGPLASVLLAWQFARGPIAEVPPEFQAAHFGDKAVAEVHGVTDLGRAIALYTFSEDESEEVSPEEQEDHVLAVESFKHQVIRLAGPDVQTNCHGWVFTGGRYGVAGESVEMILADNGYEEVEQAREGDLVIYRSYAGGIEHTGLVRFVGTDRMVLVESKWGPLGVYLHAPESQPYGREYAYYRSAREGHQLALRDGPTGEAPQLVRSGQ
jgi:hypothetical protein